MGKLLLRALLTGSALFAIPAAGLGMTTNAAGASETIEAGGRERTYLVHVPTRRPPKMPLLLVFHGGGGSGQGMPHFTGFDALADRYGFLAVYPDGVNRQWNDGGKPNNGVDDVGFVRALIVRLEQQFSIDRNRIFAAGISNGAMFSQRLGCELADRIAGIAAIDGNMPIAIASSCHPSRAVSVLLMNGTADPLMPFDGGNVTIGRRVAVASASQTVAFWGRHDGCAAAPSPTTLPAVEPADGTSIEREQYLHCRDGSKVTFYIVHGGGHTWPGGYQYLPAIFIGRTSNQLDASRTIAEFFLTLER
ncbi:MAG: esterase [Candidatus Eremiobacteraeota bacterium]|nr:esterase [Candidatus Eremiobacteraeota bacterium]